MNSRDLSLAQLEAVGFLAQRRRGNFIDGVEAMPANGAYLAVTDPATEMVIAEAPDSDAADVNVAVAAARRAFEGKAWRGLRPADRERLLFRLSLLIEEHAEELSALETLQSLDKTPDLIIADYHLDQGTGTEAIAAIRRAVGYAIPAIAVTADHTARVQAEIRRDHIAYLRKPIKTGELFALIHKVIAD